MGKKRLNKKIDGRFSFMLIIFLVAMLLVSGCSLFKGKVPEEEVITKPKSCEEMTNTLEQYNCFLKKAIDEKDISYCDKVSEVSRTLCIVEVAKVTGQDSFCDSLEKSEEKEICEYRVALETKDISKCTGSEEQIKLCKAIILDDEAICDEFTDAEEKEGRYMTLTPKSTDWCNEKASQFSEFFKDYCFFRLAHFSKDKSYCKQAGILKDSCKAG